jgi:hypothetical protein
MLLLHNLLTVVTTISQSKEKMLASRSPIFHRCLWKPVNAQVMFIRTRKQSPTTFASSQPQTNGKTSTKPNPSLDRTISLLDDPAVKTDRSRPIRERSKISKPLEKPGKLVLDDASKGVQDTFAEEIVENMNAALGTTPFVNMLRGVEDPSEIIEIAEVKLNQDYSHIHATWRSNYFENILTELAKKDLSPKDGKFSAEMIAKVNIILQEREGKFRSFFIKDFNFRRVPRIYFKPDKVIEDLLDEVKYAANL